MKLLLDQNLSPNLVSQLEDVYPESKHVYEIGMGSSTDDEIWNFTLEHNYTIVSKDSDFSDLSVLRGFPPKLIWIRLGNCATREISKLLRDASEQILAFHLHKDSGILMLY